MLFFLIIFFRIKADKGDILDFKHGNDDDNLCG